MVLRGFSAKQVNLFTERLVYMCTLPPYLPTKDTHVLLVSLIFQAQGLLQVSLGATTRKTVSAPRYNMRFWYNMRL